MMLGRILFASIAVTAWATTGCTLSANQGATASAPPAAAAMTAVATAESQAALTPATALADLKAGNEHFISNALTPRDYRAQVAATAAGQYPKAVILSCLDSRIPPELVFDQGIGDLFVARIAGNFENTDILGSMEFATQVAGAKLIVVLGHTSCGAIKGACDAVELGNLTAMLDHFDPAIAASASVAGEKNSKNHDYVAAVTDANIRQTMRDILGRSPVLTGLVEEGKLQVVGGLYDLESGKVTWIEG